jgi:hypothetical protein
VDRDSQRVLEPPEYNRRSVAFFRVYTCCRYWLRNLKVDRFFQIDSTCKFLKKDVLSEGGQQQYVCSRSNVG